MVEYGIVKFFDARTDRRYGFVRVLAAAGGETGEEIFFHYNGGRFVDHDTTGPYFGDVLALAQESRLPRVLPTPRKGDRLVFTRREARRGAKALPWSYASEWESIDWRIILKRDGHYTPIIRSNTTRQSVNEMLQWTGESLGWQCYRYSGSDTPRFSLQIRQSSGWCDLKPIAPLELLLPENADDGSEAAFRKAADTAFQAAMDSAALGLAAYSQQND